MGSVHGRNCWRKNVRLLGSGVVVIRQMFISPGHNYFGHHGRAPDDHPLTEVDRIECVAGQGIRGDRFYDYKHDYKGQITFFSEEVFEKLSAAFPDVEKSPGSLRRNVIVSGANLNALIGEEFSLQGVRFLGTAHCKPCYWLDQAFAPGTEAWLKGNGGLRARILTNGRLTTGPAELLLAQRELAI
jgi:MOSC domain-containing protein YiiM